MLDNGYDCSSGLALLRDVFNFFSPLSELQIIEVIYLCYKLERSGICSSETLVAKLKNRSINQLFCCKVVFYEYSIKGLFTDKLL